MRAGFCTLLLRSREPGPGFQTQGPCRDRRVGLGDSGTPVPPADTPSRAAGLPARTGVSVTQSCLTLCDPRDCSPPGSSVHGILQARILGWVVISSSRRVFPTQGLNPGLLPCRRILYPLPGTTASMHFLPEPLGPTRDVDRPLRTTSRVPLLLQAGCPWQFQESSAAMSWRTSGTGGCPGHVSSSPASSWPARASRWGRPWREPWRGSGRPWSGTPRCGTPASPPWAQAGGNFRCRLPPRDQSPDCLSLQGWVWAPAGPDAVGRGTPSLGLLWGWELDG